MDGSEIPKKNYDDEGVRCDDLQYDNEGLGRGGIGDREVAEKFD